MFVLAVGFITVACWWGAGQGVRGVVQVAVQGGGPQSRLPPCDLRGGLSSRAGTEAKPGRRREEAGPLGGDRSCYKSGGKEEK